MDIEEDVPEQRRELNVDVGAILSLVGVSKEELVSMASDKLVESVQNEVRSRVKSIIQDSGKTMIEDALQKEIDSVLGAKYTPVDEWGEKSGKETSLRDMIKARAVKFMGETVDESGKSTGYRGVPRGEWYAKRAAESAIDWEAKQELKKAVEIAKKEIKEKISSLICEHVIK